MEQPISPPQEAPQPPPQDPFEIVSGIQPSTWSMLIYGQPGVGKSTVGKHAPRPFFLDLENGLKTIACDKNKMPITSYEGVVAWLRKLIKSDFETIVIDTVDKIEEYLSARVVDAYNKTARPVKTVGDIPYGRGGDLMVAEWRAFIDILDHVGKAGKNVLLTGHEQIVKFENPSDANYDYFTVNVHKKAAPILTARMDAVLFARFETVVKDKDPQKGKGKASTTGDRVVHTATGASWVAKNRYDLPETMPLDAGIFAKITKQET